ncbi:hypothetical protein O3P69_006576 [Scylla paramamosain]|uniref:Uncharacterized protein n=1 Tax=Scylla paramamosain TaxID=85552 RepID=A0AAW0U456_SCYPA
MRKRKKRVKEEDGINCEDCERRFHSGCQNESSKEELWRKIEDVLPDPNPPIAPLEKSQNSDKLDQHIVNDHGNLDEGDEATAHVMDIHDEFYQVMPRCVDQIISKNFKLFDLLAGGSGFVTEVCL